VLANDSADASDITCSITVGSADSPGESLYTLSLRHHIPATLQ